MARGVNKVILIGNLGADPEVRYTPNGNAITNVNIATSTSYRDKQTNEQVERTEWHRVVFFNRLAEIIGEYLRKGSRIYVEGSLRTRKWQDKTGADRYTTEVVANEMQMLDSRNAMPGNNNSGGNYSNNSNNAGGGFDKGNAAPGNKQPNMATNDNFDDDIPF